MWNIIVAAWGFLFTRYYNRNSVGFLTSGTPISLSIFGNKPCDLIHTIIYILLKRN